MIVRHLAILFFNRQAVVCLNSKALRLCIGGRSGFRLRIIFTTTMLAVLRSIVRVQMQYRHKKTFH